jgi:hypothetical protein
MFFAVMHPYLSYFDQLEMKEKFNKLKIRTVDRFLTYLH